MNGRPRRSSSPSPFRTPFLGPAFVASGFIGVEGLGFRGFRVYGDSGFRVYGIEGFGIVKTRFFLGL